ncbi:MAG: 3-hydroxybutyrate dehydrogenase [Pseudomonadota bacterium]
MLKGKTALVTGSTSGIGLAMADALAREGANIMLNGLGDAAEIENTRSGLEKRTGAKVAFAGANLMKADACAELVAATAKEFGQLDILINNAGMQFVSPIEEFPVEKWDAIMALNLSAPFHTIRAALPAMKQAGWGRIINTGSAHSLVASPYKSAYVTAKHGLAGLTKTVALEAAEHGVTCNTICPGYVSTELVDAQIADTAKARGMTEKEVVQKVILEAQPTKEFVTVEQIAGLAVFLCSDAAASMTGVILPIDGGWTAQ